uniref:Uncharacterized protein n=1 Tax=Anguilla anguilla TaxID=7936 RepID=A0A0E9U2T7_ANGAN
MFFIVIDYRKQNFNDDSVPSLLL